MSYTQVGECKRCGAPIYAESPWFGVVPPRSMHSCDCFAKVEIRTTTTSHINIKEEEEK